LLYTSYKSPPRGRILYSLSDYALTNYACLCFMVHERISWGGVLEVDGAAAVGGPTGARHGGVLALHAVVVRQLLARRDRRPRKEHRLCPEQWTKAKDK
jgi:hypothetical protein